jgi:8-amino-7-oxononanoate synthase
MIQNSQFSIQHSQFKLPMSSYDWLQTSLNTIHKAGWYRSPRTITSAPGSCIEIEGRPYLNFSSNDYLGLANDPRLKAAAIQAIQDYGTGSTGSRLVTGDRPLHRQLERDIARLKGTEDALVFSSGYSANIGTIAALMGKRDLILNDQYNHSSLRSGSAISGATCLDYQHCDVNDLKQQLEKHRSNYSRCLILTDSVFSMDGDLAPLSQILDLAEQFDAMVLVDEAHGTGVLGASGSGGIEACGCRDRPVIHMGTLSKALGSLGGYVAGSATLIDFLKNRAPSWIYTTALSPADTAAAIAAIQIIQSEPSRRDRLWQNITSFKTQLTQAGIRSFPSDSAIVCIPQTTVKDAVNLSKHLQDAGIFAPAIRPPTVPTSRLRLTLMATHTPQQITTLFAALQGV